MQESPFAMTGRSAEEYLNERQKFVWRRPDRFNFVRDILYELAVTRPKATALYWTSAENEVDIASFEALRHRVNRAAGLLRAIGVNRGDVVLVFLSREKAWWEMMLACLQLGAIASPGTTQLMEKDIAFRLRTTNAAAVVTNATLAERVDAAAEDEHWRGAKVIVEGDRAGWTAYAAFAGAPVEDCADTKADDEALWYFTSGTTGNPKMTVHGCGYPLGHETTGRFWLRAGPDDLVWNVSDTGWAKGAWSSLFAPWLCGAGIFALHANSVDPERILSWLEKFPVSILCAPPTAYRMFVRHDLNGCRPMRLRHCVSAGEPLNPEVIEIWRNKMGMQICEGYGQTETTILC
ncbi:MAG: AMP-binding protein, partial [Alphaproteobacteria bacterium]|nr:AMP-binding protein [Alphaproteobacteria bacterium]